MNIFIHRRDLRVIDNTTLNLMYEKKNIIPIFIFTPEQISENQYFSSNLVQFMCESLLDLKKIYKKKKSDLYLFYGNIIDVLDSIHNKTSIKNIGFNIDYSPYSKERDTKIIQWCKNNKIKVFSEEDMLLTNIVNNINYNGNDPYKVFTPFMRFQKNNFNVSRPFQKKLDFGTINTLDYDFTIDSRNIKKLYKKNKKLLCKGGRSHAKKKIKQLENQKLYGEKRNIISYETTRLSPYINLGLLSIREVYYSILNLFDVNHPLITELYWRDFYYNILYHYPHIVGNSFKEKYDNIIWDNNEEYFDKWCRGQTGFPIVDACMRELNETGYMHNRGRMIVASFLTKDLFIDWKWGEKYFANQLIDYNISANNGGWQWSAGSGTDAQPYFRIFNPWTQSKTYDPECKYIKKWIKELKDVNNDDIHNWFNKFQEYDVKYPSPIVNHSERRKYVIEQYQKYL